MLDVAGGRGWKHLLRDVPVSGQLHGGQACRVLQLQVQARIRQVPGQGQHVHTQPAQAGVGGECFSRVAVSMMIVTGG